MLAIVIPYYKREYFEDCLRSLSKQTNKNFKVYIGDDASSQDPSKIIERFKGSLDLVYHRFNENLGGTSLTKQWHRCIDLSQGERWLMILGDDDFLSTNYVAEFYNNLGEIDSLDIKVVRFASRILREPSGDISDIFIHPKLEKASDFIYRRYFEKSRGSLTEQVFRRDAYLKYGFANIPLGWGADLFAWLQFSEYGLNYTINKATAFFRISDHNISRGGYQEKEKAEARIEFFSEYLLKTERSFSNKQELKFLKLFEQILYKHKKINLDSINYLLVKFLNNSGFIESLKFLRRLFIHITINQTLKYIGKLSVTAFKKLKYKAYTIRKKIVREYHESRKTEFERRIWQRKLLYFNSSQKQELSNFRLYRSDKFSVWKNTLFWQRRLENKLNAKEFAIKCRVRTANKLWNGRIEEFQKFKLDQLPSKFTIKPVRGEGSKNVFLINNSLNLFDNKEYSKEELEKCIRGLFKSGIQEIIIEEFLANEKGEFVVPNDYRFYMFNGKILFIQMDKRKSFDKDQVSFYDSSWKLIDKKILVDAVTDKYDPPPNCLNEMKVFAETLSMHYNNFVRIDFYATNKGAVFGEFTPTPRKGKFLTNFGNKRLIEAWDYYCKDMY